jgi:hypothetical protein
MIACNLQKISDYWSCGEPSGAQVTVNTDTKSSH